MCCNVTLVSSCFGYRIAIIHLKCFIFRNGLNIKKNDTLTQCCDRYTTMLFIAIVVSVGCMSASSLAAAVAVMVMLANKKELDMKYLSFYAIFHCSFHVFCTKLLNGCELCMCVCVWMCISIVLTNSMHEKFLNTFTLFFVASLFQKHNMFHSKQ